MAAPDKKEYLKKYLNGPEKTKIKKKSKVKKANYTKSRIIDDDIDIKNVNPEIENSDKETDDEAPTVALVIDDRPIQIRSKEAYVTSHWKVLDGDDKIEVNSTDNKRHDSDSDFSPPRAEKSRHDSSSDLSPPRSSSKNVKDSRDSEKNTSKESNKRNKDLSPPRKPKAVRQDSDSDISPPRRNNKANSSLVKSRSVNRDSDSDLSPPRPSRNRTKNANSDLSPPRKSAKTHKDSGSDLSPPRTHGKNRSGYRNNNRSPSPRSGKRKNETNSRASDKGKSNPTKTLPSETLSGLKAGLQNAQMLRTELLAAREREQEMIKKIGEDVSGKGAETVFRDRKTGKRRNLKEEKRLQRIENEKKAKYDEKYMEWGKGLKQVEEHTSRLGEEVYEMSKPLARYADDEDLEKLLKEKEREGDPMLKFIKKKKEKQLDPSKIRPTYKGPAPPPNRFGVLPGYRWDGVDRSNGFEQKYFDRISNKIANEEEAYKWSVENM